MLTNDPSLWRDAWPWPKPDDHKHKRGHLLCVSGPATKAGAIRLTARGGLRIGAGLVTVLGDEPALQEHAAHFDAIMLSGIDSAPELKRRLTSVQRGCIAIGPGLGTGAREEELVRVVWAADVPAVFDADALTALARVEPLKRQAPTVLTPHDGEFARLAPDLVDGEKDAATAKAARRWGAVLVRKGPRTFVSDGQRIAVNANGTPFLATAGSGDTLTGFVASLLAQGMPAFEAACAAVWVHADAGRRFGPGLTADDLADAALPVLRDLYADRPSHKGF